jgi:serine/threonine protein kinase
VELGDLHSLIQRHQKSNPSFAFSQQAALEIGRQVALAMEWMHKRNFIHRDIKTSNILIDGEWNVKLTGKAVAREAKKRKVTDILKSIFSFFLRFQYRCSSRNE